MRPGADSGPGGDRSRADRCLAPPLAAAIRVTLASRAGIPSGRIGLAWHITLRGDRELIWHNGMTGGYSAMIALDPARSLGVAALANAAGAPPSPLDEAVFAALG